MARVFVALLSYICGNQVDSRENCSLIIDREGKIELNIWYH